MEVQKNDISHPYLWVTIYAWIILKPGIFWAKIYPPIILHDIQISFMGAHNIDLNKLSNKHECSMVVLFVKTSQYIDIEWNSHFRILFENIGRLKICLDMEN